MKEIITTGVIFWQRALCLVRMSQSFFEYVSTSNSDYKLTKAPINMKPTPVTPARLEVFEEVPTTNLPELPEAPNRKNYTVSN